MADRFDHLRNIHNGWIDSVRKKAEEPEDRIAHYSTAEGWFYVCDDGSEVGPFVSEWAMFKYMEDRDINEPASRK